MEAITDAIVIEVGTEKKIHISFSEFSKYQQCGYKHLLEKYLKIVVEPPSVHLFFGSAIHKAIELGIKNKADVENRVKTFKDSFTNEMNTNMKGFSEKDFNNFLIQGENIIRYVYTEKIFKKYNIIGVEIDLFEHLYGSFYFKGFIDLVLQDKETGRYLIIDWKTSGEAWDVSKKKKDIVFMAQMRFYKYFFSRKNNIPMENIDCNYLVLNRLQNKKYPELGFGKLQKVEIYSDNEDIEGSIKMLAETIKKIHINNDFLKAKLNGKKNNCFFCAHKTDSVLCSNNPNQYLELLKEDFIS